MVLKVNPLKIKRESKIGIRQISILKFYFLLKTQKCLSKNNVMVEN